MPDLNDDLFSSFKTEGSPVNPLPASEVRRRGDRMRRRNNTLAAVGGVAAALVVIATPLAVVANQSTDEPVDPPIATQPTQAEWLQEIPADVDVSLGIQGTDTSQDPEPQDGPLATLAVCGETAFDGRDAVDASSASYQVENSELRIERTLALYPTGPDAGAALDELRTAVADCPTTPGAADGDRVVLELEQSDLAADESFLVTESFFGGGEDFPQLVDYYIVARTGNALLVTHTAGIADDPSVDEVQAEQDAVADVVEQMKAFSEPAR